MYNRNKFPTKSFKTAPSRFKSKPTRLQPHYKCNTCGHEFADAKTLKNHKHPKGGHK